MVNMHFCVTVCIFKWAIVSAILALLTHRTYCLGLPSLIYNVLCVGCVLEVNK